MENNQFDYINVIPLVDIMLVLLTIVLTTSTLIATGSIPVSLPDATAIPDGNHTVEVITITKDGTLHYRDRIISLSDLSITLSSIDRTTPVVIRADRGLLLQQFVDILDVIKKMQFGKVSLQTEMPGS